MRKKLFDYVIINLVGASAALLIVMLFTDLAIFDNGYNGYFVLDAHEVHYFWHAGRPVDSETINWVSSGLILAAMLLMIPVVLRVLGKNALWFLWLNVVILLITIGTQYWGIDHAAMRIFNETNEFSEISYEPSFYFPFYALGFSFIAALLYSFYGKRFRNVSVVKKVKE